MRIVRLIAIAAVLVASIGATLAVPGAASAALAKPKPCGTLLSSGAIPGETTTWTYEGSQRGTSCDAVRSLAETIRSGYHIDGTGPGGGATPTAFSARGFDCRRTSRTKQRATWTCTNGPTKAAYVTALLWKTCPAVRTGPEAYEIYRARTQSIGCGAAAGFIRAFAKRPGSLPTGVFTFRGFRCDGAPDFDAGSYEMSCTKGRAELLVDKPLA